MWELLLTNGVIGGVTGYFTNSVALKMLFKSYFGIGGVIPKEYQKFKEGIGELIEEYLVNPESLTPYLQSQRFHIAVERGVERWLGEQLPGQLEGVKLTQIPGGKKLVGEILKLLREKQEQLLFPLVDWYLQKPLQLFISEEQFLKFQQGLDRELGRSWEGYLRRVGVDQWQLNELFSDRFWEEVERGIEGILEEPSEEWKGEIRELMAPLLRELIGELEREFLTRPLRELFPVSIEQGGHRLIQEILEFLETPDGKRLVEGLVQQFLNYLKGVRKSLAEVIGEEGMEGIENWLKYGFPYLFEELVQELERDRRRLERRIDRDIKEYFSDSFVVSLILDLFFQELSSRYQVVRLIREKLEEFGERAPEEIGERLRQILKERTIGELVKLAEQSQILTPQFIGEWLVANLREVLKGKEEFLRRGLERILEARPVDLGIRNLKFLEEPLLAQLPLLFYQLLRQGVLEERGRILQELQRQRVGRYLGLIPYQEGLELLRDWYYQVAPKPLRRYISPSKLLSKALPLHPLHSWLEQFQVVRLLPALQNRETYHSISQLLIDRLTDRLPTLLKGRVKELVVQELAPLKPEEVGELAYNFFGTEMKPITLFGGALGFGVGVGVAGVTGGAVGNWIPAVYGLTGIGTNYLAIEMLFRPYTRKWYLPGLSPGVLVKKRGDLALHISHFVSARLLTEESIRRKFQQLEEEIGRQLIEDFSRDEYRQIRHWIGEELHQEMPLLTRQFVTAVVEEREWVAEQIAQLIWDRWSEIAPQLLPFLQLKGTQLLADPEVGRSIGFHLQRVFEEMEGERVLKELKPLIGREVGRWMDEVEGRVPELVEGGLRRWQLKLEEIGERSPVELGIGNFEKLGGSSATLHRQLLEWLEGSRREVVAGIKRVLNLSGATPSSPSSPSQMPAPQEPTIGELFGGQFGKIVRDQLTLLFQLVEERVREMKPEIVEKVLERVWRIGRPFVRRTVEEAVGVVLERTIPSYLQEKRGFILYLVEKYLLSQPAKLLRIELSDRQLEEIWVSFWRNPQIQKGVLEIVERGERYLLSKPLSELLSIGGVRGVSDWLLHLKPQIEGVLHRWLRESRPELLHRLEKGAYLYFHHQLAGRRVGEFLKGVRWEQEGRGIQQFLYQKWKGGLKKEVMEIVWEVIVKIPPDREILKRDFGRLLGRLEEGYSSVEVELQPVLKEIGREFPARIPATTLQWGVEVGIKTGLTQFQRELPQLLEAVELPKVVGEAFLKLPPEEIEGMFRGFAQPYFNRLILYGGFGALFSLPLLLL